MILIYPFLAQQTTQSFDTGVGQVRVIVQGRPLEEKAKIMIFSRGREYVTRPVLPAEWTLGGENDRSAQVCGIIDRGDKPVVWLLGYTNWLTGVFLYRFVNRSWRQIRFVGLPDEYSLDGHELSYSPRGHFRVTNGKVVFVDYNYDSDYAVWDDQPFYAGLIELHGDNAVLKSHILTSKRFHDFRAAQKELNGWKYAGLLFDGMPEKANPKTGRGN